MNQHDLEPVDVAQQPREDTPQNPLSMTVRYLRQQLGLTQEELAQALGITVGTVSRWEKGRFRPSRLARQLILEFARSHNIALPLGQNGRPH